MRLDLVLVGGEQLRIELRLLGLLELAGLRVDLGLLLLRRLGEQLLLELGGQDQLEDAEVSGLVVEVDPGIAGGPRLLLVRRQQGVLERRHQRLGIEALLLLEDLDCFDDLAAHDCTSDSSGTRFERLISSNGISISSPAASMLTASAPAAVRRPVKFLRPSIGSAVRIRAS